MARNPVPAGLTSLSLMFGVASVIAMLAIGRGAKQEILTQLRLLGTNNEQEAGPKYFSSDRLAAGLWFRKGVRPMNSIRAGMHLTSGSVRRHSQFGGYL